MILDKIRSIRERIETARLKGGIVDEVLLLAVTKNHPVEVIYEAAQAGITAVGENKVQEAKQKKEAYTGEPIEWHLIGHLQVNKVRQAVPLFDLIHSVDSERVLKEIDKIAARENKIQRILLQVNVACEESKYGMQVEDLPVLVEMTKELKNVKLEGLMCMAPFVDEAEAVRPIFRIASYLYEDLKNKFPAGQIKYLSMGMTNDFEVAITEGANIVRIGSAIFGERY